MRTNNLFLLSLVSLVVTAGCNSNETKVTPSTNLNIEEQLKSAAKSIDESYRILAKSKIHTLDQQVLDTEPMISTEAGLGKLITIDWSGPIEPMLAKISSMADYQLKIIGRQPAIPVVVTLVKEDVSMADSIKDADLQAAGHANVVVYPKDKVIELRYLN